MPLLPMKYRSKQLEDFIEDLSPAYRKELELIIEERNPRNRSETDQILAEFRRSKRFIKLGKFTEKYWIQRGWSMEESRIKKNDNRKKANPDGTPMQIDYWRKRINPKTDENYTEREALYKIRSQRKLNYEYWIERGLSEEDAKNKAREQQIYNSSRRKKYLGITWNQYEYWMEKENISENEAKDRVSKLQDNYSIKKLMEKYGKLEGAERYEEMCRKLSHSQSIAGFIERYGEDIGEIKYRESIIKRCSNSGVSKESIRFFVNIYKNLRKHISRDEIYWGISGSKEYFIYDNESKKIFFYDFTIPTLKVIIEYHGKRFHPNPKWDKNKWKAWNLSGVTADQKRGMDLYKNSVAKRFGFDVIEIFYDDINEKTQDNLLKMLIKKIGR